MSKNNFAWFLLGVSVTVVVLKFSSITGSFQKNQSTAYEGKSSEKPKYEGQDYEIQRLSKLCEAAGVKLSYNNDNNGNSIVFPPNTYYLEGIPDTNKVYQNINFGYYLSLDSLFPTHRALNCGKFDVEKLEANAVPWSKLDKSTFKLTRDKTSSRVEVTGGKVTNVYIAFIPGMKPIRATTGNGGGTSLPLYVEEKDIKIAIIDTSTSK
jgi:hypothetical protein